MSDPPQAPAPAPAFPVPPEAFTPPGMDDVDRLHPPAWEWWDAIAVFVLWVFGLVDAGAVIGAALAGSSADLRSAVGVAVAPITLALLTLGWVQLRTGGSRRLLGPRRWAVRDLWVGVVHGVLAFLVVQLGLGLLLTALIEAGGREVPEVQEGVQQLVQSTDAIIPWLIGLSVVVASPIAEELLYRGMLYQALAKRVPGWPAIGLSGLAFALTHGEALVIVLTFPLGMYLAFVQRRHGSLAVPIVAHLVFNTIGVVLIRAGL